MSDSPIDVPLGPVPGVSEPSTRQVDGSAAPDGSLLDSVAWHRSYDRESVEAYLAALDAEWYQVQAELAEVESRTAEAERALAEHKARAEARLGEVVLAARNEIDRIELEQRRVVGEILAAAEAEATRIRDAARLESDAVRHAARSLSSLAAVPTLGADGVGTGDGHLDSGELGDAG